MVQLIVCIIGACVLIGVDVSFFPILLYYDAYCTVCVFFCESREQSMRFTQPAQSYVPFQLTFKDSSLCALEVGCTSGTPLTAFNQRAFFQCRCPAIKDKDGLDVVIKQP